MKYRLEIKDIPEGLSIRSVRSRSWALTIAGGVLFAILVYSLADKLLPAALAISFALAGGVLLATLQFPKQVAVLTVTKFEMTLAGRFRRSNLNFHSVPLADIRSLQYRSAIGSGNGGLYAGRKLGFTCVLPNLDATDCQLAIEAIRARFPHIADEPDTGDSTIFKDDLVRLNIGQSR